MRHADIRVTMKTYGTVFDDAVNGAGLKVAELAFMPNGAQAEYEFSQPIAKMVGAIGFEFSVKRIFNDMQVSG